MCVCHSDVLLQEFVEIEKNRIRRVLTHNHTVLHCYQCNHVRTASALMILNHACSFLFFLERVSVCVDRNMCAQASLCTSAFVRTAVKFKARD